MAGGQWDQEQQQAVRRWSPGNAFPAAGWYTLEPPPDHGGGLWFTLTPRFETTR